MPELKAVVAVYHARDRMNYWSKLGVFWGSIWGFLSGTVFFAVAGTGPVLVSGSLLASIIAALQGGVVVGALTAIGAACTAFASRKTALFKATPTSTHGDSFFSVTAPKARLQELETFLKQLVPSLLTCAR